jgi:hypothetical protein
MLHALAKVFGPSAVQATSEQAAVRPGSPLHVALWDAINEYARHWVSDSSANVAKQKAVAIVEKALRAYAQPAETVAQAASEQAPWDRELADRLLRAFWNLRSDSRQDELYQAGLKVFGSLVPHVQKSGAEWRECIESQLRTALASVDEEHGTRVGLERELEAANKRADEAMPLEHVNAMMADFLEAQAQIEKCKVERDERAAFAAAETEHANKWSVRAQQAESQLQQLREACEMTPGENASWTQFAFSGMHTLTQQYVRRVVGAIAAQPPTEPAKRIVCFDCGVTDGHGSECAWSEQSADRFTTQRGQDAAVMPGIDPDDTDLCAVDMPRDVVARGVAKMHAVGEPDAQDKTQNAWLHPGAWKLSGEPQAAGEEPTVHASQRELVARLDRHERVIRRALLITGRLKVRNGEPIDVDRDAINTALGMLDAEEGGA